MGKPLGVEGSWFEVLMRRGAAVEETDADPWATPMAWARKMKHGEILMLLEQGQTSAF